MTYRVECDLYSDGIETEVAVKKFIFAQEAANFTRSWVAEQPSSTAALPRARMYRNEGKPRGVMLSVWRKPDGEICERRK